jgi:hypothetical protein
MMRLYVSKKHHQKLLMDLAAQLGSDSPTDALEHILNCWTVLPPSSSPQVAPNPPTASTDPMAGLVQF